MQKKPDVQGLSMTWKQFDKIEMGHKQGKLTAKNMHAVPLEQFDAWIQAALNTHCLMPNAMTLSTVNAQQEPDARIVLLMRYDEKGLVFFTNYLSAKGQQLANNPKTTALFFWPELERQVRIQGLVEKISESESDEYFATRSKEAQIAAVASPQSQVIPHYTYLIDKVSELNKKYASVEKTPRPPHWGGYLLVPHRYEFWQGGPNRLHDRMVYRKNSANRWIIERLAS